MAAHTTPRGTKHTSYSTQRGDSFRHTLSPGGTTERITATSQGLLPPYTRTATKPGSDKVFLHSDKKGAGGGRKYNPDDTHVRHLAPSLTGHSATPESHNSIIGSAKANQEDSRFERSALGKLRSKRNQSTVTTAELKKTKVTDPDYLQEAHEAVPGVPLKRLTERSSAYAGKSKENQQKAGKTPSTPMVQKSLTRTVSTPGGTAYGTQRSGPDVDVIIKEKWRSRDYDSDDTSGDDDIKKGK